MEEVEDSIREEEVEGPSSVEDVHPGPDARTITTMVMIVNWMRMDLILIRKRRQSHNSNRHREEEKCKRGCFKSMDHGGTFSIVIFHRLILM